jgi:hypothetical protein
MRNTMIAFIFLALLTPYTIHAQQTTEEKITSIPYIEKGAEIDGVLDDSSWQQAAKFSLDFEVEPGENIAAPVKTLAYMFYSKNHLYVGFKAFDPKPGEIRGNYWERDKQKGDDEVWFELDTFNDGLNAFIFQSNVLGVQSDFINSDGNYDSSWDAIFDTATSFTDYGYSVEFKIPFSSISFQPSDVEQTWGVLLGRSYPRDVNHQLQQFARNRNVECHVCQFEKIVGFKGVQPGNNIEITPTINAIQTSTYDEITDDYLTTTDDIDAGLSAKWGITNNSALGVTINPDFSQVEADALLLDINTPFALSYEEKRPFFTEGASFYATRQKTVYTRAIRDPEWGVKYQGKEGNTGYGVIMAKDAVTNILFPGSQRSQATQLAEKSTVTIARLTQDILTNSNISAMITNREAGDYHNRVYGVDASLQLSQSDRLFVQAIGSSTQYPDAIAAAFGQPMGEFSSGAIDLYYIHDTRNFDLVAHYFNIGEDFRADAGFMPQVGLRKAAIATSNTWYDKNDDWWDLFVIDTVARDYSDSEGNMLSRQVAISLVTLGDMQSNLRLQGQVGKRAYLGEEYNDNFLRFIGSFVPHGDLSMFAYLLVGDQIDFANARAGDRIFFDGGFTYKPSKHLSIGYTHTFERMEVAGERLYTANIGALTTLAHFNSRLLFRAIVQYVDYDYAVENYTFELDSKYETIASQLLLSYKINPRTLFFLGFSNNYSADSTYDLRQDDYTFFMKLSYAFRL